MRIDRNDRPWPGPGYKATFRVIYAALLIWDFWPPTFWLVYIGASFTLAIWMFIEWVWLRNYRQWLWDRAAREFYEAAHAGAVRADCPMCGDQDIPVLEFSDHLRLFHPDIEAEGMQPNFHIHVQKPPLWVRLW